MDGSMLALSFTKTIDALNAKPEQAAFAPAKRYAAGQASSRAISMTCGACAHRLTPTPSQAQHAK
jgi:hypothetical protein